MNKNQVELTIIVPCYNEAQIIEETLPKLYHFLELIKIPYEIIIIDDCSKDDTVQLVKEIVQEMNEKINFIQHKQNKGRGYTVREGILLAKGKFVGFIDIDLEISEFYILPAVIKLQENADVVIGNRLYKVEFSLSSLFRWILSRGYNSLVRRYLQIPFSDTEAGFKFFNREKILPVAKLSENNHWFWDTEIVALSYKQNLKIEELSVVFTRKMHKNSTVKVFHDTWLYLQEVIKFQKKVKQFDRHG